jgi:hypothetical protein
LRERQATRIANEYAARTHSGVPDTQNRREQVVSLTYAVITRWTSHYLACARLLRLRKDFEVIGRTHDLTLLTLAGKTPELKREAGRMIETITNEQFWVNLT